MATQTIRIDLTGMPLKSEANQRDHPLARYRRGKKQKERVHIELLAVRDRLPKPPCMVRFIRGYNGRGKPYDDDNLCGAWKAIRDQVADFFGVSDAPDSPLRFEYRQEKGKAALAVEIEPISEAMR